MSIDATKTIAYCGLICFYCFQGSKCQGCKSSNNKCDMDLSDEGCYQKNCCTIKGYDGCWECNGLKECEKGIYSLGKYSKIKAFALCIKEDGKVQFIKNIQSNMRKGLSVEKGKDYDNKSINEVLKMIRSANA